MALRADEKGLELLCDIAVEVPETVRGDPGGFVKSFSIWSAML